MMKKTMSISFNNESIKPIFNSEYSERLATWLSLLQTYRLPSSGQVKSKQRKQCRIGRMTQKTQIPLSFPPSTPQFSLPPPSPLWLQR